MSHYDTLGVPSDATQDDIKRAYRRAARAAHPDMGGDASKMQAINEANDVLSDLERRAHYDEHGSDKPEQPDPVRQLLLEVLAKFVEADDGFGQARRALQNGINSAKASRAEAQGRARRLAERVERMRFKGSGENFALAMLNSKIEELERTMKRADDLVDNATEAMKMLDDYEDGIEIPPAPLASVFLSSPFYGGTSTFG